MAIGPGSIVEISGTLTIGIVQRAIDPVAAVWDVLTLGDTRNITVRQAQLAELSLIPPPPPFAAGDIVDVADRGASFTGIASGNLRGYRGRVVDFGALLFGLAYLIIATEADGATIHVLPEFCRLLRRAASGTGGPAP